LRGGGVDRGGVAAAGVGQPGPGLPGGREPRGGERVRLRHTERRAAGADQRPRRRGALRQRRAVQRDKVWGDAAARAVAGLCPARAKPVARSVAPNPPTPSPLPRSFQKFGILKYCRALPGRLQRRPEFYLAPRFGILNSKILSMAAGRQRREMSLSP